MYYKDLVTYEYGDIRFPDVRRVGWLEPGHPFDRGTIEPKLLARLYALGDGSSRSCAVADRIDGLIRPCGFCGYRQGTSSSELWIPASDGSVIYSTPSLLPHYLDTHEYLPPDEFLCAVDSLNPDHGFSGQALMSALMKKYGYATTIPDQFFSEFFET